MRRDQRRTARHAGCSARGKRCSIETGNDGVVAEASGGRAFFPLTVDEARMDMERVARDLREQYTLGYIPSNPSRAGEWRSVRVEISPPPGLPRTIKLNANYRHGYYGPGN